MTLKKITSMALVLGMITANTGCVYQAELTEFLDDPTGMKAKAEMTTEYEMPPDETEYEFYEYEYEETTDTAEPIITELSQVTDITETTVTTITTEVTDITESAEEESEITTSAETEEIIFASAEPTEKTEPTEEVTEWVEPTEQPTEEEKESPAEEPTDMSDYQKALEIFEYMTANGTGTCVQHSYQTYQMCLEYGLPCYIIWTENKLYGHVANAVYVEGVWYVLDTQAGCFLTENMCGFTEIVDENENYIMSADNISPTRYE